MTDDLVKKLTGSFSYLNTLDIPQTNLEICKYYSLFTDVSEDLVTALVYTPFGETENIESIQKNFGKKVYENILLLERFQQSDLTLVNEYEEHEPMVLLFLSGYQYAAQNPANPDIKEILSKERVTYAMSLLEQSGISHIKHDLVDYFFQILEPEIFNHYSSLLEHSRATYEKNKKYIKEELQKLIAEDKIKADVQHRLKSIYSIHEKIITKNILLSQVLDVIGIRIITEKKEECYAIMESIIAHWPIINSRVKDYIAVPKENEYQSIHLTVLIENHPVEIQIRNREIHEQAEFGKASHLNYKKKLNSHLQK